MNDSTSRIIHVSAPLASRLSTSISISHQIIQANRAPPRRMPNMPSDIMVARRNTTHPISKMTAISAIMGPNDELCATTQLTYE